MILFHKYHGTGNDFIMVDNRDGNLHSFLQSPDWVARACDRHFGIGADGLIALETSPGYDFNMQYFNADGHPGTMCGNGGRCAVAFAKSIGIQQPAFRFKAIDGPHRALILEDGRVSLKMTDVEAVALQGSDYELNTGSPHLVVFVDQLADLDVVAAGRERRNAPAYKAEGINVNFVKPAGDWCLEIATYERGVENETLSCGTGVTAASLAYACNRFPGSVRGEVLVVTKGGKLTVTFERSAAGRFENIWLTGPATFVFSGSYPAPL